MSRITVPGHIYREDSLAVLHVPGIFRYQMAGAALCGDRIRHTVIKGAYAREVLTRIQGTMDMTALTVPHNDEVTSGANSPLRAFSRGSGLQAVRLSSATAMQINQCGRNLNLGGHTQEERETGFEPATFSLGS